jgi:hypothetical protein
VLKLRPRIITETKSFRPTSIKWRCSGDKPHPGFESVVIFQPNPGLAVEIGGLSEMEKTVDSE